MLFQLTKLVIINKKYCIINEFYLYNILNNNKMKKENEIQSLNEIAQYLNQCEAKYYILDDSTDEFTMHDITFTATTNTEGWIELKNRYLTIDNFMEYYNNSGFILTEKKYLHLKQNNSYYIIYVNICLLTSFKISNSSITFFSELLP